MRELFSRRPQPYYIQAPDYRRSSAGIRVMHMLCDALNRSGQEAYITANVLSPELVTPRLTDSVRELHLQQGLEAIVVYPEIVDGNPLNGGTVVRYLLNHPGFIEGKGLYAEEDILFAYTKALLQPNMADDRVLYMPAPDVRVFSPPADPAKRIAGKVCYYQGRRGQAQIDRSLLPADAVEITPQWPDSWEKLADIFQQCEYFYCGEASGLAGEAALCGCLSVIIPGDWAPRQLSQHENKNYGLAWGTDPEEIERARQTLSLFRESLLQHQINFWPALDHFIEITQSAATKRAANRKGSQIRSWLASRVPSKEQGELIEARLHSQPQPRLDLLVLDQGGDRERLERTLQSLDSSAGWHIHVLSASAVSLPADERMSFTWLDGEPCADVLNRVVAKSNADWFMLVEAGEELTSSGQLIAQLELVQTPGCRAISFDEIYRQDGALGAACRPSFNLDYLLSFPAGMARHWLFRREVVLEVGGFDPSLKDALELDLILRLVNQGGLAGLGHISEPLLITDMPALANIEDERKAIVRHLQARGYSNAQVTAAKPGRYRLEYRHADSPVVSILIPAGAHLSKLQRCLDGLLGSTAHQAFEILLIETHSQDQAVHDWLLALAKLQEAKLRVIQPVSGNMAAVLNQAAHRASGDYLLFLASDTAIVKEDWLDNLLNHAQRAEVGGVGGRLLTPDGKIAQAMQILGLQGPLGNPYVGEKLDEPGYMQRLQVDQNVSALSQDCLMLPRDLYVQLGGLVEEEVPSPYAMTDLCLRIREAGYLLVWSPSVQLMLDRQEPAKVATEQQDAMYAKWLPQLACDPAYNPNFSLVQPGGFKLADTQISWRPLDIWRPLPVVLAHPADTMGCGHYRVMQPFNALREAGMVDGALSVGLMHVVDLERYNPDAVILQRQIGEERLEAMRRIKAFSRAFKVYELDDYLPNLPMKSVHRQHLPKDIVKSLRRGLSYVDRFVVSTDVMAEAFAGFHPNIRVVRNRLDPRWWGGLPISARRTSNKPRVGWAGGASHTGDLEMIADVVKELADEVEWVFFGMCPAKLKPYIHEFHEGVAIERYAKKLASLNLDLALAPVEQNLFNECKSNLRLLEYGACGFPVICSDVRCYQGDGLPVTQVKNRFRDWVDAIRSHINDLDAAAKAGDDLRAAVLAGWMLEEENLEAWRKAWLPD
ncbi:glycosyltransferase [Stutzerimonas nitrititolerans]|uniref:glycosyltransferase n=1 Tax=Stutzerimonas nitrititolerans TaxID=2482751 RepID=UPI000F7B23E5|nr:glycosyltransferase [Stutzerimonas nitrititolerans]RRV20089.1 glycosyltransferase [Pseudomonas sp. s199]